MEPPVIAFINSEARLSLNVFCIDFKGKSFASPPKGSSISYGKGQFSIRHPSPYTRSCADWTKHHVCLLHGSVPAQKTVDIHKNTRTYPKDGLHKNDTSMVIETMTPKIEDQHAMGINNSYGAI